jgi:hypothetical protein
MMPSAASIPRKAVREAMLLAINTLWALWSILVDPGLSPP